MSVIYEIDEKQRKNVHLVCIGHLDHGKSSILGRLFYDTDSIGNAEMERIRKMAKALNKEGFEYAFIMDQIKEERARGITIGLAHKKLITKNSSFTFADAPGHKDFIKNMLVGASESDGAILVVAVDEGIQSQTKEHLFLADMLGLTSVIVVINKMDLIDFKKEKFEKLTLNVQRLLKNVGYIPEEVPIIPCSALLGENVVQKSQKMDWYKGPTLLEILENLPERSVPVNLPLRLPVQDIYKINEKYLVIGRLSSGTLSVGERIIVMPQKSEWEVENLFLHGEEIKKAEAEDNIYLSLKALGKNDINRGNIIGKKEEIPAIINTFIAQIVVLNCPQGIMNNYSCNFEMLTEDIPCKIKKIIKKVDTQTGATTEESPEKIEEKQSAIVEIETHSPVYIELQREIPQLARFRLAKDGKKIAIGVCTEREL